MSSRRFSTRDLALVATFAGVMAALGVVPAISVPAIAVPITAQSMGPMLAGSIIGARRGAASMLLFLALVAVGLPLLSGGRGGLGVFTGPSMGFLLAFPLAALVIGLAVELVGAPYRLVPGLIANLVGGVVVVYALGIPALAWRGGLPLDKALTGSLAFVPGDLVKVVVAALVARGVHAGYPGLLRKRRRRGKSLTTV